MFGKSSFSNCIFSAVLFKLFTFGGYQYETIATTEVFDLEGTTCQQPSYLPFPIDAAAFMKSSNGNPLLCGGTGGLNNSCLEYIPSSDTWVDPGYTIRERGIFNPSSAEISGGRWWVCGGTGVSKSFMNNLDFA